MLVSRDMRRGFVIFAPAALSAELFAIPAELTAGGFAEEGEKDIDFMMIGIHAFQFNGLGGQRRGVGEEKAIRHLEGAKLFLIIAPASEAVAVDAADNAG